MALDLLVTLLGTGIYAFAVHMFTVPNNIAPGGVTGISTMVNYLTGIPVGTVSLLINLPLLLLGYRYIGRSFALKTMVSVVSFTLFIDVLYPRLPVYQGDLMLASLFGGVLIGVGLGIVFTRGSSTGGTDITNRMVQRKFPHIKLGRIVFITDSVIILLAAFVFQNIESSLYALVAMFASSLLIDLVVTGLDRGKLVYIVSAKSREISEQVMERLARGVTVIRGEGAYSGKEKKILMVALRMQEYVKLKRIVRETDPAAFMIVSEAGEILGEGFRDNSQDLSS